MALIQANWNPTDRQLRQFSAICAVALPLVGWIWSASTQLIGWLAAAGLAVAVVGWVAPRIVAPIFVGLTLITMPIGIVVGELAMLLIYVLVFLPMGAIFWLMGRNRLELIWDRRAPSYWRPKAQPKSVANYYRQS